MFDLLKETASYVIGTLAHNAPFLAIGILFAAVLKVYIDPDRMRQWLLARSQVSIPGSVAFGAFTPFWACGTMAVAISILASSLPWGPIMAFLVSSPLMSPSDFVFYAGILGTSLATALLIASIGLGLAGGYMAYALEKRTRFFDGQIRFEPAEAPATASSESIGGEETAAATDAPTWDCGPTPEVQVRNEKLRDLLREMIDLGVKKILLYFSLFAAIGFFVNKLVPAEIIMRLFSGEHWYAVPLAALTGLPLYVSGASAVPLLDVLAKAGASPGSVLAFLITGPATSVGVIAGIATIMRRRAIALYVAIILVGGIIAGYGYDLVLRLT